MGVITPTVTWRYAYCGGVFLGDITSGPFTALSDNERNTCNAWSIDWTKTKIDMVDQKDNEIWCYIKREYDSFTSEFELREGMRVPWYIGFNVWASPSSQQREAGGVSEQLFLQLGLDSAAVLVCSCAFVLNLIAFN